MGRKSEGTAIKQPVRLVRCLESQQEKVFQKGGSGKCCWRSWVRGKQGCAEFSGNMQVIDDFDKSRFSVHQNGLKTNVIWERTIMDVEIEIQIQRSRFVCFKAGFIIFKLYRGDCKKLMKMRMGIGATPPCLPPLSPYYHHQGNVRQDSWEGRRNWK